MVAADKGASSGVRYKHGRNLNSSTKNALVIKDPAEYKLPAFGHQPSYVIAKDVHGDGINVIMQGTRYDVNKDGSKNPKTIAGDYDSALYINSKVYKEKGMM